MNENFFAVMAPAAVIRVSGEDAARFLQGQFSNDLRNGRDRAVYGLWLDARAKICGDSFIIEQTDGSFLLVSYYTAARDLVNKLERFIIADAVELENVTGDYQLLVCSEEACVTVWQEPGPPIDTDPMQLRYSGIGLAWFGRHGVSHAIDWLLPNEQVEGAKTQLAAAGAKSVPLSALHEARIKARIPAIPLDVGMEETPADAGLIGIAVSLNKGCYIGQEVVAKQNLTDRAAKALVLLRGEAVPDTLPAPIVDHEQRPCGEIRSYCRQDGQTLALAVVKRKSVTPSAKFYCADKQEFHWVEA
ncbi:MAG: hypothetical protein LR015_05600 [Verrucomicrobia bacterium]|nr:hypothetical protein [Verrucomicrobiota bacterium]